MGKGDWWLVGLIVLVGLVVILMMVNEPAAGAPMGTPTRTPPPVPTMTRTPPALPVVMTPTDWQYLPLVEVE